MRRFTSVSATEPEPVNEEQAVIQPEPEVQEPEVQEPQQETEPVDKIDISSVLRSLEKTIDRIDEMAADIASLKRKVEDEGTPDGENEDNEEEEENNYQPIMVDTDPVDPKEDDGGPSQWAKSGNDVQVDNSEKRLNFWMVFFIAIALVVITAICWKRTLPARPVSLLDIEIPEEITVNKVVEIPVNVQGTPGICVEGADNDVIECAIKNGVLLLKARAEGNYTFALAIAEPIKTHLGIYKTTVTGDLGGAKYKKLADDVEAAIKEKLPKEYWSYCKEIGKNFKQVVLNHNIDTVDGLYARAKKLNEDTLKYNDPSPDVDVKAQAAWYEFMNGNAKEGTTGVVQELLMGAASNESLTEHRALFNALAEGFSRVE